MLCHNFCFCCNNNYFLLIPELMLCSNFPSCTTIFFFTLELISSFIVSFFLFISSPQRLQHIYENLHCHFPHGQMCQVIHETHFLLEFSILGASLPSLDPVPFCSILQILSMPAASLSSWVSLHK